MEDTTNAPLIIVACRFVPYDQWMVTHLDTSWTIKQVKQWILSKCNLVRPPDAPRYRPVSPITFAAIDARSSFDLGDQGSGELGDLTSEGSDDTNEMDYGFSKYRNRSLGEKWSRSDRPSASSTDEGSIDNSATQNYTLLAFSTSQTLDDDYILAWFDLHPYELLEMHPAGVVISLPREVVAEYVRPYFEAKVQALRIIHKNAGAGNGGGSGRSKDAGTQSEVYSADPVADEVLKHERREKRRKEGKTTFEWADRWLVIHQGILSMGIDRSDRDPAKAFPVSSLMALKGAEYLSSYSISSAKGKRVLCAKFRSASPQNSLTQSDPSISQLPSSSSQGHLSSNHRDVLHSAPASPTLGSFEGKKKLKKKASISGMFGTRRNEDPSRQIGKGKVSDRSASASTSTSISEHEQDIKQAESRTKRKERDNVEDAKSGDEGQWIILDMYDDTAYTSLLRILHRHSPRPVISTFLPSTSTLISNAPSTAVPPQNPNVSFTSPFSGDLISPLDTIGPIPTQAIPYPEWRTNVVVQARKAGLGIIGRAMDLVRWGDHIPFPSTSTHSGRSRRDTVATFGSGQSEGTIQTNRSSDARKPVDDSDDHGYESSEPEELSDVEWEGWIRDLDRQTEVEGLRRRDETTTGVSDQRPDYQSHLPSPSSSESFHQRTRTVSSSPSMSSASASPSTSIDIPSNNLPRPHYQSFASGVTSTVSVGPPLSRKRSTTVTVNSVLRRKDKGKDKQTEG